MLNTIYSSSSSYYFHARGARARFFWEASQQYPPPLFFTRDSGFDKHNLKFKAWNSQAHKEFPIRVKSAHPPRPTSRRRGSLRPTLPRTASKLYYITRKSECIHHHHHQHHHPVGVVYIEAFVPILAHLQSFEIASRRWWCIESLFPISHCI